MKETKLKYAKYFIYFNGTEKLLYKLYFNDDNELVYDEIIIENPINEYSSISLYLNILSHCNSIKEFTKDNHNFKVLKKSKYESVLRKFNSINNMIL